MALEGNIRDFGLPDIFQLIGLQKKTGILTITGPEDTVDITFNEGDVIWAASKNRKQEDRLGRMLLKSGRISEEKLKRALELQQQSMQRLGYILVKSGHIDERELRDSLQIQVLETIYHLFRWKEGTYSFQPRAAVDFHESLIKPMRAEAILMEGIRMLDEWPLILEKISDFSLVPHPASMGTLTFDHTKLEEPIRQIYEMVDGQHTVQEIIDNSLLGEFDTCSCLKELISAGLIELGAGKALALAASVAAAAKEPGKKRPWAIVAAPVVLLLLAAVSFVVGGMNAVGFLGLGPAGKREEKELKNAAHNVKKSKVEEALWIYYLASGTYPPSLSSLVEKRLLSPQDLQDAAGRELEYTGKGDSYNLK